jgi:thymidylate synthase
MEQANLQLSRAPKALPTLKINPDVTNLFDFTYEDFEVMDYNPDPLIRAAVSI